MNTRGHVASTLFQFQIVQVYTQLPSILEFPLKAALSINRTEQVTARSKMPQKTRWQTLPLIAESKIGLEMKLPLMKMNILIEDFRSATDTTGDALGGKLKSANVISFPLQTKSTF